jgi:hypothetical protein
MVQGENGCEGFAQGKYWCWSFLPWAFWRSEQTRKTDRKDQTKMKPHYSAADALEAVEPDVLALDATIMAMTAYWNADRPGRLPRPWPGEKTAKMLRQHQQYEFLKAAHLCTFDDLGLDHPPDRPRQ